MTSHQKTDEGVPTNHVLAVLAPNALESALGDLERAGFGSYRPFSGEAAANEFDAKGEKSGPVGKLIKMLNKHLSEEPNYLAQYEEEAREGKVVLAVRIEHSEAAEEVRDLLERHGARNIRLFGTMAVTDLSPLSNPSLRSEESPEQQATKH